MDKDMTLPVFELPTLFSLDGMELTADNLIAEAVAGNTCSTGTGSSNSCHTGASPSQL